MRRYTLSNDVIELHGGHVYQLARQPKIGVLFGPFQMEVGHKLADVGSCTSQLFRRLRVHGNKHSIRRRNTKIKKVSREIGRLEMNPGLR
jgi:hypothetical protein